MVGSASIKVPRSLLIFLVIAFIIFIVGGGIYDLINRPPSMFPTQQGWVGVNPYMSEQTINESIFAMLATSSILGGLLLAYKGTFVMYDRQKANMMLIAGISLILLGLSGNYYLLFLKRSISI